MALRDTLTIQGVCCTVQHRAGPSVAVVRRRDGSVALAVRTHAGWHLEPSPPAPLDLLSAMAIAVQMATR